MPNPAAYMTKRTAAHIAFDVAAVITFGLFSLDLSGFYHGKEAWGFVASLGKFKWSQVTVLYKNIFNKSIEDFDHHEDISVLSYLTLSFSSVVCESIISAPLRSTTIRPSKKDRTQPDWHFCHRNTGQREIRRR